MNSFFSKIFLQKLYLHIQSPSGSNLNTISQPVLQHPSILNHPLFPIYTPYSPTSEPLFTLSLTTESYYQDISSVNLFGFPDTELISGSSFCLLFSILGFLCLSFQLKYKFLKDSNSVLVLASNGSQ